MSAEALAADRSSWGLLIVGTVHVDKDTQGRNSRIRVPAMLAAVAVVLLALGAAATASAHGSSAHGAGPLAAQWWLFALAALCGGVFLVTRLRRVVTASDPASTAEYRLHRGVLAMAAVATAAVPVALFLLHAHESGNGGECATCPMLQITATGPQFTPSVAADRPSPKPGHESLPLGAILLVVCGLAALALAVALIVLLRRWLRGRDAASTTGGLPLPALAEDEQDESALGRAVLAGRDALEGEARAAIISCYAAMEASLDAAGVPRLESDSPADLLARAAARGALDGPAPRLLASLFREARYSTHPMDAAHLGQARGALDEIAAQLTARRAAQEAAR